MGEKRLSAPAALITLAEAKAHLRVTHSRDDAYITGLITTSTAAIETMTRRSLGAQQWQFTFSGWRTRLELGQGSLMSVDSVEYIDTDGVTQTLATTDYYVIDDDSSKGVIVRNTANLDAWPDLQDGHPQPVIVTATTGYAAVPEDLKHAIKMHMLHLYENREAVVIGSGATEVPMGVQNLVMPYLVPLFR